MARTSKKQKALDAIAARQAQVSEQYFLGISQRQIAQDLEVEPSTISRDIQALRAAWAKDKKEYFEQHIIKELARIDWLEQEAEEAWRRSKTAWKASEKDPQRTEPTLDQGEATFTSFRTAEGAKYGGNTIRLSHGNSKYLEDIRWCIEMRCKLLGLIVDKKDITSDGKPVTVAFIKMPMDEL